MKGGNSMIVKTSMTVKTRQEAWEIANKMFTTDYDKNEEKSDRAGYPIYTNKINNDQIADLNDRLEVVVDGKTTNIWVKDYIEAEKNNNTTKLKKLIENNLVELKISEKLAENNARVVFWKLEGEWEAYPFTLLQNNSLLEHNKNMLFDIRDIDEQAVVIGIRDFKKNWEDSFITLDEMVYTIEYRRTLKDCHNNINVFLERVINKEQEQQTKTKLEMKEKDIKVIEDFCGNRFLQIDTDTPYKEEKEIIGTIKAGKENGKLYCTLSNDIKISLKKEDRRTLNGVMFAKIV